MAGGIELGDIVASIGLDSRPFSRGMRRAKQDAVDQASELRSTLQKQFDFDPFMSETDRQIRRVGDSFLQTVLKIKAAGFSREREEDLLGNAEADYNRQIARLRRTEQQMVRSSRNIGQSFQGMSRRGRNALTQLAFATDDFFGVWQNSGSVSAAIRATSNNIGTLVTMINPLAGIATTVAFAFGSQLVKAFVDTEKAADSAGDAINRFGKNVDAALQRQRAAQELRTGPFDPDRLREVRDELGTIEVKERNIQRERESVIRRSREGIGGQVQGIANAAVLGLSLANPAMLFDPQAARSTFDRFAQGMQDFALERARRAVNESGVGQAQSELRTERTQLEAELQELERRADEQRERSVRDELSRQQAIALGTIGFGPSPADQFSQAMAEDKEAREQQKRDRKEQQQLEEEMEQKRQKALDIRLDLQSQILDEEERKVFNINRRYDELRKTIEDVATAKDRAGLLALNEQARQAELSGLEKPQEEGGPLGQLATFKQRGSASAVSAVNRAAARAMDKKAEEKQIAKNTAAAAQHLAQIASALTGGAPQLALISDLSGGD